MICLRRAFQAGGSALPRSTQMSCACQVLRLLFDCSRTVFGGAEESRSAPRSNSISRCGHDFGLQNVLHLGRSAPHLFGDLANREPAGCTPGPVRRTHPWARTRAFAERAVRLTVHCSRKRILVLVFQGLCCSRRRRRPVRPGTASGPPSERRANSEDRSLFAANRRSRRSLRAVVPPTAIFQQPATATRARGREPASCPRTGTGRLDVWRERLRARPVDTFKGGFFPALRASSRASRRSPVISWRTWARLAVSASVGAGGLLRLCGLDAGAARTKVLVCSQTSAPLTSA